MNWKEIGIIYKKEIKDILRDHRTLILMVVVPVILYPLLLVGISRIALVHEVKRMEKSYNVAVTGKQWSKEIVKRIADDKQLKPVEAAEAHRALEQGAVHLILDIEKDFDSNIAASSQGRLQITYDETNPDSTQALARLRQLLQTYEKEIVKERLKGNLDFIHPIAGYGEGEPVNIRPVKKVVTYYLGKSLAVVLSFLIVAMSLLAAFYPSVDIVAGEKERGTLETLLSSPAGRLEIAFGKFFTIFTVSFSTAALNIVSLTGTFIFLKYFSGAGAAPDHALFKEFVLAGGTLFYIFITLIPLTALFSSLCLAISSFARSSREGQFYLSPLFVLIMPLSLVGMIPDLQLSPVLSVIPVVGPSLLFRELMLGHTGLYFHIFLIMLSTLIYAGMAVWWAASLFKNESILFREVASVTTLRRAAAPGPSAGLGFAVFLVSVLLTFYGTALLGGLGVATALLIATVAFILLPPVAASCIFKFRFKDVFAARRIDLRSIALSVLIGLVTALVISQIDALQKLIFGASASIGKEFEELVAESIRNMSLPAALFLGAVAAPVCEELLFRGFIFSSFRKSFGAPRAVILSAVLFALGHLSPTNMLALFLAGIIFGYLRYRTRSIVPAIGAHCFNNLIGILAIKLGLFSRLQGDFLPWYVFLGSCVLLFLCIFLMQRER